LQAAWVAATGDVAVRGFRPAGLSCRRGRIIMPAAPAATGDSRAKPGTAFMPGLYFEEFKVGQTFRHAIRRTITETDNVWFSALTHNPAPLHIDAEYCKQTEFGKPIVNSCLTLGFMVGISVGDTTVGTTVANLGWDTVRFPKPLFHGDTIHVESEVLELRNSKSRPENGIVVFAHRAFNQHDELVGECKRSALMLRKPR
jgi:acyl dehydratase